VQFKVPLCASNDTEDWDCASTISLSKNGAPKISALSLKIGEMISAKVVFLQKPNDFYLQAMAGASKMEEIAASVAGELEAGTAQDLNEGDGCWAKFSEDNTWYRATVSKIKVNEYFRILN